MQGGCLVAHGLEAAHSQMMCLQWWAGSGWEPRQWVTDKLDMREVVFNKDQTESDLDRARPLNTPPFKIKDLNGNCAISQMRPIGWCQGEQHKH